MLDRAVLLLAGLVAWHGHGLASATALTGKSLSRTNSPTSPCLAAYDRLRGGCSTASRFPQSTAYNSTHSLQCELVRSGCGEMRHEIEFTLQRSTWWHCSANATMSANSTSSCNDRFHADLMENLFSAECTSGNCFNHSVPAYIGSLRDSAMKLYTVDSASLLQCTSQGVGDTIELMANVIMQKARFCRFDMDMYVKMTDLVNLYAKQARICSVGTGTGAGTGTGGTAYSYSYSVQSQPVYQQQQQQSYSFQTQQQQFTGQQQSAR